MKDKLPKRFVIRTHTASPLWVKYEAWLSKTTNKKLVFKYRDYNFYGIESSNESETLIGFNVIEDVETYDTVVLTLEQWHAIAYPEYEVVMVVDKPSDNDFYFKTIEQAIQTYGTEKQVDMWFEESSELTKALCKYRRNPTEQALAYVREEIEDAGIMIDQLRLMFSQPENSYDIKQHKVQRLYNRLNPTTHD